MKKSSRKITLLTIMLMAILVIFTSCADLLNFLGLGEEEYEIPEGVAQFHFIDIGQGDSSLIAVDGKYVLVDTGDASAKDELVAYLNEHNVKEIEYFIVTHPDADHFASASYVVENYTVKNLIMTEHEKTTKMYETFIKTLEEHEDVNVISANQNVGASYMVGDLEIKLLAPLKSYSDPNAESIVFMARFGNTKVLYTGDAETETEEDMLEKYFDKSIFDCDVLKVGHHGSDTSSSQEFLNVAKPEIAVISCGKDNKYGHPHDEPMERLNAIKGITIYRTDEIGSIVLESDGEKITKK